MRPHRTRRHLTLVDPNAPPPVTGTSLLRDWLAARGNAQLGVATRHGLVRDGQRLLDTGSDPAFVHVFFDAVFTHYERPHSRAGHTHLSRHA